MSTDTTLAADRRIWRDELPFDEALLCHRIATLQADIAARGLTGLLLFDPENMFWLTGYQTIGYFTFQAMLLPREGLPVLVTRVVNRDLALALPTIGTAVAIFDTDDPITVLADALPTGGRIGLETTSRYLSVHDHRQLVASAAVAFEDCNGLIEMRRRTKGPEAIERMRRAATAVEAGMAAALAAVKPGARDNDVAAALYHGSIAAGSEYIGHPPMVVSGPRSALCFALWRRRTIARGDVVLIEGAGCVDRYHAMMARTAVVGPPTDEQKASAEALTALLETAVATIRPGETAGEIDRRCREGLEKLGLAKYFKSRTAYGIGIGFPPNWAEGHIYAIRPDDETVLEENMTFHVIPTMFREDFGMAISDSVRVSATGCEVLTRYPRDLVVVD
ncbi:M24 family metallopeptidase [Acuticoccus sediminis]|uniref:M24 family metallopeptidase n=1 Tax=Acuticoccus sediminis TaxID=2184697 RepID=UPI001390C01F|nr:Xaa-Pro peptidase family protein [Acuticoccus sediminis]